MYKIIVRIVTVVLFLHVVFADCNPETTVEVNGKEVTIENRFYGDDGVGEIWYSVEGEEVTTTIPGTPGTGTAGRVFRQASYNDDGLMVIEFLDPPEAAVLLETSEILERIACIEEPKDVVRAMRETDCSNYNDDSAVCHHATHCEWIPPQLETWCEGEVPGHCKPIEGFEIPSEETDCDDYTDNDLDGLIDCWDSDCSCEDMPFEISCVDGFDNDNDGLIDCEDLGDCYEECQDPLEAANCNDGIDNDNDGLVDCSDIQDCYFSDHCHCNEMWKGNNPRYRVSFVACDMLSTEDLATIAQEIIDLGFHEWHPFVDHQEIFEFFYSTNLVPFNTLTLSDKGHIAGGNTEIERRSCSANYLIFLCPGIYPGYASFSGKAFLGNEGVWVTMHELGHAICQLDDEYVYHEDVSDPSKINCDTEGCPFWSKYDLPCIGTIAMGDYNGCKTDDHFRSSEKSIMSVETSIFNQLSCAGCLLEFDVFSDLDSALDECQTTVYKYECEYNDDCGEDNWCTRCMGGNCVDVTKPCSCEDGFEIGSCHNGVCIKDDSCECSLNEDCPECHSCVLGTCRPFLRFTGNEVCNCGSVEEIGSCVDGECILDDSCDCRYLYDCPDCHKCEDGQCIPSPPYFHPPCSCSINGAPGNCQEGVCVEDSNCECGGSVTCPLCQKCEDGVCIPVPDNPGLCNCAIEGELGTCLDGVCVVDPTCTMY